VLLHCRDKTGTAKRESNMEISDIILHIEVLIFASDRPLTEVEITELINNAVGSQEDKLSPEQVRTAIDQIVEKYASGSHPFEIRESGGGLQFLTKKEFHGTIAQLNGDKFIKRLSNAALETLAIIAYKQPVTKGEIESIRGVSSDYSIQKLLEKDLVVITGRNEEMPGKPLLYATSKSFMDYFGINSSEDLPKLKEVITGNFVEPTVISREGSGQEKETEAAAHQEPVFAVTEHGELVESEDDQPGQEPSKENDS
jgi:segregation and condensation protein B